MNIDHMTSTFGGAGGTQLYLQSWLPGEAARGVIALVHGFGEHSGRYRRLVEALTKAGYAVCALDQRGHGRSPGQRGHVDRWDDFMEDIGRLLEQSRALVPHHATFLFGHSVGGLLVLQYAIRYPAQLQGVIASAPMLAPANIPPLVMTVARTLARVAPTFPLDTGLDATTISRDPVEVRRYLDDPLVHSKASARAGTEVGKAVEWAQAHAADLQVPLLIYHGTADRLIPIDGTRRFFAGTKTADRLLIEMPGGYHESHNDVDHAILFALMLAWLDKHTTPPGG